MLDPTSQKQGSTRVGSTRANRGFNPKYDSETYLGISQLATEPTTKPFCLQPSAQSSKQAPVNTQFKVELSSKSAMLGKRTSPDSLKICEENAIRESAEPDSSLSLSESEQSDSETPEQPQRTSSSTVSSLYSFC